MKRRAPHVAAFVVGAVILAACAWYIVTSFQWREIGRILDQVDLLSLIAGGGSSILLYWVLRALRWQFLLRKMGVRLRFADVYLGTAVALSFALVTPLMSGEILKVELLRKFGLLERFDGYGTFAVERVLDLAVLLSIGVVSVLTLVGVLPGQRYVFAVLAMVLLAALGGMLLALKLRPAGKAGEFLGRIRECVRDPWTLLGAFGITCASWASVGLSWQVLLASGGVGVGYLRSLALMAVVALIAVLSLIPGGLGISEVGNTQILMRYGLSSAAAQAGALLLRSYTILALALGAAHLGVWQAVRRYRRGPTSHAGAMR